MLYCAFNKEEIKNTKTNKTKELWGESLNIVRVEIRFFFPHGYLFGNSVAGVIFLSCFFLVVNKH